MWIAYRIGLAVIALIALIALFVCQYRLSSRLARREAEDLAKFASEPLPDAEGRR